MRVKFLSNRIKSADSKLPRQDGVDTQAADG